MVLWPPLKLGGQGSSPGQSAPGLKINEDRERADFALTSVNGKPFASSRIRTLNRRYLGSPINWAIAC